jgi:DNA end-binding protein Ku
MVDEDGTPLARRYVCPAEDRVVERDELVRGYEVEEDRYVILTQEELEALEPEKTREIDLRRFVPVEELDPAFFQRAYVLTPADGSTKAYRLLAETMEERGRAGIATVVMRTKEYLVAIVARDGILRAETMRFHDELRSPEDVGLPDPGHAPEERVATLVAAMEEAAADEVEREELEDPGRRELEELVARKLEAGEGVKEPSGVADEEAEEDEESDVVDLMAVLRRSLARGEDGEAGDGE